MRAFIAFIYLVLAASSGHAEELSNAAARLQRVIDEKICPTSLESEVKYSEICEPIWGDGTICPVGDRRPNCRVGWNRQCTLQVDEYNRVVRRYNSIAQKCNSSKPGSLNVNTSPTARPAPPTTKPASSPSALERAAERQRLKAKDAEKINDKNKADADAFAKKSSEEMSDLQEVKRREEEVRQNQERIRKQIEAEYIPPGWSPCRCPDFHRSFGKTVHGILYHGPGLDCP